MFTRARTIFCTVLSPTKIQTPIIFCPTLTKAMEGNRFASNNPDTKSIKVNHDPEAQEFHIKFPNSRAYLVYEKEDNLIKIMHTEVPEELGGKGVGKLLAQAALRHIEQHKYRAEIYCHFVQHYVEKYEPKYLKYLEK